jgi:hypothetical protein
MEQIKPLLETRVAAELRVVVTQRNLDQAKADHETALADVKAAQNALLQAITIEITDRVETALAATDAGTPST